MKTMADYINEINKREVPDNMSQYVILLDLTDVGIIPDDIIIEILNNNSFKLSDNELQYAKEQSVKLLKENTDSNMIDIKLVDNNIYLVPKVTHKSFNNKTLFTLAKTTPDIILKPVYNKLLKEHKTELDLDLVFVNKHIKSFLTTDGSFIVYDDSVDFMKEVLEMLIEKGHMKKLIPKSQLMEFIIKEIKERETVFDYITNDVGYILFDLKKQVNVKFESGEITESDGRNFLFQTLIGNTSIYNMEVLNNLKEVDKPRFSVGLLDIFNGDFNRS